jgi:hypothetical protein
VHSPGKSPKIGVVKTKSTGPTAFITLVFLATATAETDQVIDPVWVDETWDVPDVDARCADSIYAYSCARAIEDSILATRTSGIQRLYASLWREPWSAREGDTLRITLKSGAIVDMVNHDCDCASATKHWYLGRVDRMNGHVVFVGHHEGHPTSSSATTPGRSSLSTAFPWRRPMDAA